MNKIFGAFTFITLIIGYLGALPGHDFPGNIFLRGDVLYWKPHISNLELAFGEDSIVQTTEGIGRTINSREFDEDPKFHWNAGYRVGAGFKPECTNWFIGSFWTHFNDNGTRHSSSTNEGKCRVKLDQLDVLFTVESCLSCFKLNPYFGVRGVHLNEKLHSRLITDIILSPTSSATGTRTLRDKQNYYGGGPLIGIDAFWDLGCNIDLYGTIAASLLYGHYNVHFNDSDIFTAPLSESIFNKTTKHLHAFDANIDLAIGFIWNVCIYNTPFMLKLGFEHHQFFNQSRLGLARGDLSFDGGTFSISTEF